MERELKGQGQKNISGGRTGADWATLDVAIEHDIPHGGWIPKGRKTVFIHMNVAICNGEERSR